MLLIKIDQSEAFKFNFNKNFEIIQRSVLMVQSSDDSLRPNVDTFVGLLYEITPF